MGRTAIGFFSLLLLALEAQAYTPTLTPGGAAVRWKGKAKLDLAGNPINQSGIDDQSFFAAVTRSLSRWKKASAGSATFDYWQGTEASVYVPGSEYDGLSSIYFASNTKGGESRLSPNVLGLTQVWYNTDTGQILETDIVLNDKNFKFTTNPRDTSGYGSARGANYAGGRSEVFIENVLTHELGHAYGLSHSGGLQSTMLFMESPEQAHLGCDESVAIHALYPNGDARARGAIEGSVVSESGKAIFGAHVVAVSRRRGTALATVLTDKSGRYRIDALEPGSYFLMVEPFFAGAAALPGYFSGISSSVCAGNQSFGRTILMDGTGLKAKEIKVGAGSRAQAPQLTAKCGNYGGAALAGHVDSSKFTSAPLVFDGLRDGNGFGIADKFIYSDTTYYKLKALSGRVEVHALSYSLYSPVHPTLRLLDGSGSTVGSVRVEEDVYEGDSGYINYDAALVAENLPAGEYYLEVSASEMDATRYPAGPVSLDSVPFILITGSVNEGAAPLSAILPDNARCLMDESFAAYSSPPGNPPRHSAEDDSAGGVGFCGSTSDRSGGGGGSNGPTPGAMVGWFLPWLMMAAMARIARQIRPVSQPV